MKVWQENEAAFGGGQFGDLEADAMGIGLGGCGVARVALVNKSNLDTVTCNLLNLCRQLTHLSAFLFIGWCHHHGKQLPKRINGDVEPASNQIIKHKTDLSLGGTRSRKMAPGCDRGDTVALPR